MIYRKMNCLVSVTGDALNEALSDALGVKVDFGEGFV